MILFELENSILCCFHIKVWQTLSFIIHYGGTQDLADHISRFLSGHVT